MSEMSNQETDTALILENELKRRVREVTLEIIRTEIQKEVRNVVLRQKDSMMFEISVKIGQMLKLIQEEDRKPLWEATPEDFGMTREQLETYKTPEFELPKDLTNALRKQTPSI